MLPLCKHPDLLEAGCDEAGRGCLAGPVVAAAVILPKNFKSELMNDSKKLNRKHRDELREIIEERALTWGVGIVSHEEIDQINILNASILAMHRALEQLKPVPEYIMVDGNRFKPFGAIPYETLVKGDGKLQNIAAASILAKTHRDDIMTKLHEEFPVFNWKQNMGYPTPEHRTAVGEHGRSPFHRKSFKIKDPQLSLWS